MWCRLASGRSCSPRWQRRGVVSDRTCLQTVDLKGASQNCQAMRTPGNAYTRHGVDGQRDGYGVQLCRLCKVIHAGKAYFLKHLNR